MPPLFYVCSSSDLNCTGRKFFFSGTYANIAVIYIRSKEWSAINREFVEVVTSVYQSVKKRGRKQLHPLVEQYEYCKL